MEAEAKAEREKAALSPPPPPPPPAPSAVSKPSVITGISTFQQRNKRHYVDYNPVYMLDFDTLQEALSRLEAERLQLDQEKETLEIHKRQLAEESKTMEDELKKMREMADKLQQDLEAERAKQNEKGARNKGSRMGKSGNDGDDPQPILTRIPSIAELAPRRIGSNGVCGLGSLAGLGEDLDR